MQIPFIQPRDDAATADAVVSKVASSSEPSHPVRSEKMPASENGTNVDRKEEIDEAGEVEAALARVTAPDLDGLSRTLSRLEASAEASRAAPIVVAPAPPPPVALDDMREEVRLLREAVDLVAERGLAATVAEAGLRKV